MKGLQGWGFGALVGGRGRKWPVACSSNICSAPGTSPRPAVCPRGAEEQGAERTCRSCPPLLPRHLRAGPLAPTQLLTHPSGQRLLEDLLWPRPGAGPQLETRLGALSPPPEELPVRWRGSCITRKLWPGLISPWPRERHRNRTNHDVSREGSLEEGRFPLPRLAETCGRRAWAQRRAAGAQPQL